MLYSNLHPNLYFHYRKYFKCKRQFKGMKYLGTSKLVKNMLRCLFNFSFKISFLFSFLISIHSLLAQETSPLISALSNRAIQELCNNYSNTHALANLGSLPYIGETRINAATVGTQVTYALMKPNPSTINEEGSELNGLIYPTRTIAYGHYFLGYNLQDALDSVPIDLLFAYSKSKAFVKLGPYNYNYDYAYFGFHYQVVENYSFKTAGAWKGLILGLGYINSVIYLDQTNIEVPDLNYKQYKWISSSHNFNLRSNVTSWPLELNTGFEIYFLSFTMGLGLVLSTGDTNLIYSRDGGITDGGANTISNIPSIEVMTKPPSTLAYGRVGVEINPFSYFKIGSEIVYASRGSISYNLGLRFGL